MSLTIQSFTFNPYQENSFVVSDDTGAAVIIDPGCYSPDERDTLATYIEEHSLTVAYILNTHGHIDHMLGNAYCVKRWGVPLVAHKKAMRDLVASPQWGGMMGLNVDPSPEPDRWIEEGELIEFGETQLEVMYTPGHAEGHVSFYHPEEQHLFSGDVLFSGSIGRTDLPGGSMDVLMQSIKEKLLPLPDEVVVYCGHGPTTTIGKERVSNPFILQYL